MTRAHRFEILNAEQHRNLRVIAETGAEFGDAVMHVTTYAMEFRDMQTCYPVLFTKEQETGAFHACGLLGFEPGRNVFLEADGWRAHYIPSFIRRQPFLIARREKGMVVSIDRASARVSETAGEALFDASGEPTEYLSASVRLLEKIHQGLEHDRQFIEAMVRHDLLQGLSAEFTFQDGSRCALDGYYCVNEDSLGRLSGDLLETLNRAGFLQPIHMAVASLSRFRDMIDRRNAQALADRS